MNELEQYRKSDDVVIKNAMEIRDLALQMTAEEQNLCLGVMYGMTMTKDLATESKEPA